MNMLTKLTFMASVSLGVLGLTACEEKGPLERAGEQVDEAAEEVEEAAEDTAEAIEDAADDAADAVEDD